MADRFKLIVAVEELAGFQRFARELQADYSVSFNHFDMVPSGLRDRVVIYCELSGISARYLFSLGDDWRTPTRASGSGPLPLHNHHSATRFANPVVPTNEEIETIRPAWTFLRGVFRYPWSVTVGVRRAISSISTVEI